MARYNQSKCLLQRIPQPCCSSLFIIYYRNDLRQLWLGLYLVMSCVLSVGVPELLSQPRPDLYLSLLGAVGKQDTFHFDSTYPWTNEATPPAPFTMLLKIPKKQAPISTQGALPP